MGGVRHAADVQTDDMSKEGQSVIGLQAGSNRGASQAGMTMGGVRHAGDMPVEQMDDVSRGVSKMQPYYQQYPYQQQQQQQYPYYASPQQPYYGGGYDDYTTNW